MLRPPDNIARWSYGYYRPVVILSYLADARVFGTGSPAGPHIFNVTCHLLTTMLVWLLARRVLRQIPDGGGGAVVAATVFAVHPIHTESVSWIAGRSDVLAALFLVTALLLALRWLDRRSAVALLLAPVFFLLALLSKEIAIVGLALLPLLIIFSGPAQAPTRPAASSCHRHRLSRCHRGLFLAAPLRRHGVGRDSWPCPGTSDSGVSSAPAPGTSSSS